MTGRSCPKRAHTLAAVRFCAALGALLIGLLAPFEPVGAAESVNRWSVTVPAGTTVADDFYVAAGNVRVDGEVTGDLTVGAGTLNVVGPVGGSVSLTAGRAEIRGRIGRSVRAVGAIVAVYGRVEGDVVAAGATLRLVEGASIGGDVVLLGGTVTAVDGATIGGDLRGTAAAVTVEGRVRGDVRVSTRQLRVTTGARIDGDLAYRGDAAPEIASGAVVGGTTGSLPPIGLSAGVGWLIWANAALPRLLLGLGVGVVAIMLLPHPTVGAADRLRRAPLGTALVGVGLALFLPLALVLLAITIVGLPVAIVGTAVYLLALYTSQVVVGLALGRGLLRFARADRGRGRNLAAMTLGVGLLFGLRLVPVPHAGAVVAALVAVVGLGAVVDGLVGRRRGIAGSVRGRGAAPIVGQLMAATPGHSSDAPGG